MSVPHSSRHRRALKIFALVRSMIIIIMITIILFLLCLLGIIIQLLLNCRVGYAKMELNRSFPDLLSTAANSSGTVFRHKTKHTFTCLNNNHKKYYCTFFQRTGRFQLQKQRVDPFDRYSYRV